MTFGKLRGVTGPFDGKSSRAIASLELFESVNRSPTWFDKCAWVSDSARIRDESLRGACHKLQETGFALRRPTADALPEPLDYLVVHLVAIVTCKFGPIIAIIARRKNREEN
jgi:hypothetical protein